MKILVVGGGGREHAIIWKLAQSSMVSKLYCAPGNGGIAQLAECVNIKATDIEGMVAFAKQNEIDLTVIAPDDPLVAGMTDAFAAAGLRAYGPSKAAAAIEGSKVFAKELMKKYNIPTAGYEVFEKAEAAISYIKTQNSYPTVIKAEGLALGKGVVIAQSEAEAEQAINEIMVDRIFGDSGSRVVIEQYITGPEVSVLAFCDGKTIIPMVSAQDHKRAFDNDQGPNTGGMGTFSPSRVYTNEIAKYCEENIYIKTVKAMEKEGCSFKGTLFFGLMLTAEGPKVIEYNCRFGDPETQVVLPRLKNDLAEVFNAVIDGTLHKQDIQWEDNSTVCVVAASGGYPGKYNVGVEINGIGEAESMENIKVFHAGTRLEGESLLTAGGRVLGVTAKAETLEIAMANAYNAIKAISFDNMHYRKDIGIK